MRKLFLTIPVFAVLAMAAVKYNAQKPAVAKTVSSKGCCDPPPCFVDPTQCGR